MSLALAGHNNPPSPIDYARKAMADLAAWLTDNPVIQEPEQAKEGALFVERSRKTIADVEDARKAEVGPLNEQVKAINEQYRQVRDPLDKVLSELRYRLTDYTAREEARRIKEAEEARQRAEALELEARRAEEAEREAKANASFGEVTDVATKIIEADQSFSRFAQADRAAQIAESQTHVRLPSQLGGKALSLRKATTLVLESYTRAIRAIGPNPKIEDAILSAARDYKKLHGRLPDGVTETSERKI